MQYLTIGLSTSVIGIVMVTAILALIAFIISSMRYLPFVSDGVQKTGAAVNEVKTEVKTEINAKPSDAVNYMQDRELVAVITAAAAASMNVPMEKLAVRSIRKTEQ